MALRCSGTFWPASKRRPTTRLQPQSAICSKPSALPSAQADARPVPDDHISNSTTQIRATDLTDRILMQRSRAGTTVTAATDNADSLHAASRVVARATVDACLSTHPEALTF